MKRRRLWCWMFVAVLGCNADDETASEPDESCAPPSRRVGERCLEPGVQDDGCPAATLGLEDGSCQPAGVPPELCGAGFEPDGNMGCEPILPAEPCPEGQMAVPGDRVCHAVMPCSAGQWGDIPVDATTVYVDAAYLGLDSDGSSAKPFKTVSDAVAAATSGALIAVAAGSYREDVLIQKTLRLWGKCPDEVEVVGTGAGVAALVVREGASGTEVHGLAIRGDGAGLGVSGAEEVLVEEVWVHDALNRGVIAEDAFGPTSITLRRSLVEDNNDVGVRVAGAAATLETLVVRRTLPRAGDQLSGRGITISVACVGGICDPTARATAVVRGALVDQNRDVGVYIGGSDATLEGLVVRGTLPQAGDQQFGRGITIQLSCIGGTCNPEARSTALVRSSLVEHNHDYGVDVGGSDATLEGLVIRGTLPQTLDQQNGRGIQIQLACVDGVCDPTARATAVLRASIVEQNHDIGVTVNGSDAALEGLIVRGTVPRASDGMYGRGINVQAACNGAGCNAVRSTVLVRGSLIAQNHEFGVTVLGSDATVEGTLVRDTLARQAGGLFGDGVSIFSHEAPASATFTANRIEASARAGLSNFGATTTLGASALVCNVIDLAGETYLEQPFRFENVGHNNCGCPVPGPDCKTQSVGLEPPEPVPTP